MTKCISLTMLVLLLGADDEPAAVPEREQTKRLEHVLYEDDSWTHIGDGRFSPQSNGFSDLTLESSGKELTVKIVLDAKAVSEIAKPKWKSAVLTGSVIGNDTGMHGDTTATVVSLDGKPIGEISKSGLFRVAFDKKLLTGDRKQPLQVTITAGQNSAADLDDQELGTFKLLLSDEPAPEPEKSNGKEKFAEPPETRGDD